MLSNLLEIMEPNPVVLVIGTVDNEPDIHQRLLKGIEGTLGDVDPRDVPRMSFRSVAPDHTFSEKKTPSSEPSLDGVLKSSWIQKHSYELPSVVIVMTPFSVDWPASEWSKREAALQDNYSKWKASLSTRDVKPLIVAVKIGVGLGIIDQDGRFSSISALRLFFATRNFFPSHL